MKCPRCGTENQVGVTQCSSCGQAFQPFDADVSAAEQGDATGGVIPYKNPKALLAYYLGILSGLPLIGLPVGIAAFILGLQGLKARKENPAIKGSVHAGIGVGCGCFFTLLWGAVVVIMVIAFISEQ